MRQWMALFAEQSSHRREEQKRPAKLVSRLPIGNPAPEVNRILARYFRVRDFVQVTIASAPELCRHKLQDTPPAAPEDVPDRTRQLDDHKSRPDEGTPPSSPQSSWSSYQAKRTDAKTPIPEFDGLAPDFSHQDAQLDP